MGKVKAMMMDMEEEFIDEVAARIGGCEQVEDLMLELVNADKMRLVSHLSTAEQIDWINEMWNNFWTEYAYG